MHSYGRIILTFLECEDGPTAVEYAVMLALVIAVCIGAITTVGKNTSSVYADGTLNNAVTVSTSS